MPADYSDDKAGIPDDKELLRRIRPDVIVSDEKAVSGYRLSSQAFEDSNDGTPCSVSVRDLAPPVEEICHRFGGYSVGALTAGDARTYQQTVCFWADPDEPGHAYIVGPKTRSIRRALAAAAKYIAGPRKWG
jgi:hypothetical protein